MTGSRWQIVAAATLSAVLGAAVAASLSGEGRRAAAQAQATAPAAADAVTAQLDAVKGKLSDQAHAMQDVGYHFTNLWFAGQERHWDLATFYNQETISHLKWAVRIIPVRKDSTGADVKLKDILQAFEKGAWKRIQDSIAAKDGEEFERAYRSAIEACYGCHKASDKPFLRPQIPTQPASTIINFEPKANWPP